MTDANLMDAKCVHGNYWDECKECDRQMLNDQEQALLGLASTEDLMKELIARFHVNALIENEEFESSLNFLRGRTLQNILTGMQNWEKRYRTVDS